MHNAKQFIFPGAILGSLILASFGYTVMARVPSQSVEKASSAGEIKNDRSKDIESSQGEVETNSTSIQPDQIDADCQVNNTYPKDILQWCGQITRHAVKNNLDPDLIAALIWQESGGNPSAYSKSGAVGLMQIMPRDGLAASFQCINGPCFANRPTIRDLEKPNFNIKFGTGMLAGLLQKYGDMREALKYYGPMGVGYYYADKVIAIFNNYRG
jgi:hypothetical protein